MPPRGGQGGHPGHLCGELRLAPGLSDRADAGEMVDLIRLNLKDRATQGVSVEQIRLNPLNVVPPLLQRDRVGRANHGADGVALVE